MGGSFFISLVNNDTELSWGIIEQLIFGFGQNRRIIPILLDNFYFVILLQCIRRAESKIE